MLLLASYLETMVTDHHLTCLKMRARNKRTATEKLHVLMFYRLGKKKIRKTLGGWQPPLTLEVNVGEATSW